MVRSIGLARELVRSALQVGGRAHHCGDDRLERAAPSAADPGVLTHLPAPIDLERTQIESDDVQRRPAAHVALRLPLQANQRARVGALSCTAARARPARQQGERESEEHGPANKHVPTVARREASDHRSLSLPRVLPHSRVMSDCPRCSRRTALVGISALVVVSAVPGCAAKQSMPIGAAVACAGGLCLDLTLAANAPLQTVGGAVLIRARLDSIAVIRTSATALSALSAVCTHESCLTVWDTGSSSLECPCHGSAFGTTGAVLAGPATRAVHVYGITLSGDTATLAAS